MFPLWNLKKPKIPIGFSYIAGAKLLSETFADIPQEATIDIWYSNSPMDHLTMLEITKRKLPYKILSAWYFVFGGSGEWHFMIHPVPRPRKHEVQSMLKEKIFPIIIVGFAKSAPKLG